MLLKDIPEFEGRYQVSDTGQVVSLLRGGAKQLRQALDPSGYAFVHLRKDGRGHTLRVHCLVALAFIGPRPFPAAQVRHLDNDMRNNTLGNLAYGTSRENHMDSGRGISETQEARVYRLLLQGRTQRDVAGLLGIGSNVVWRLAKRMRRQGTVTLPTGKNWNASYINQ